jgi:hypothetical protein
MRSVLIVVAVAVVSLVGVYTYRVNTSEQAASRAIYRYCQRRGLDTQKLIGPSKDDVPHTSAAYRWEYHDGSHDLRFFLAFHDFHALTEFGVFDEKTGKTYYPFEDGTL